MGDQDHAHVQLFIELQDQVQDLRLDRHVQGRGGLVRDQQSGLTGQGNGDHDALAHAAGQFVRILVHPCFRGRNAHQAQHFHGARVGFLSAHVLVNAQRLHDLVGNAQHRVQGRQRVLKDHGDIPAADVLHFPEGQVQDIPALQQHLALIAGHVFLVIEPHDGHARHALAASGLAHQAENLAAPDGKGNALHGPEHAPVRAEGCGQLIDLQYNLFLFHTAPPQRLDVGSSRSRSPSPNRLNPSTESPVITAGNRAIHQPLNR